MICITGAEIPSYIFQIQASFTKNLVPPRNKFADMGTAGKIVILSPYIAVAFKPNLLLIGFQGNIQLCFRAGPNLDPRLQVVPSDLRFPG